VGSDGQRFTPPTKTIHVGDTLVWRWFGNNHNITWEIGGNNSGPKNSGSYYDRTFNSPGTYEYYCSLHGSVGERMHGTITVT
jgi:plastocyanin